MHTEFNFVEELMHSEFMNKFISYKLKNTIESIVKDIKELENRTDLKPFQIQDLNNCIKDVECMKTVYIYFSGDWTYDPYED